MKPEQLEIERLRREVSKLKAERDILKRPRVARQSGWEHSDNQDSHFGGRGERIFVAAR